MSEPITLSTEMILVLTLLSVTVYLFVSAVVRVDVAALIILVVLGLLGYVPGIDPMLSSGELFSGFSSNAVISIIGVMIIGAGLDRTGLMGKVATHILKVGGRTETRILPLLSGRPPSSPPSCRTSVSPPCSCRWSAASPSAPRSRSRDSSCRWASA